jgi:hypothetical protein
VDYKNNMNARDIRTAARVARQQEGTEALVAGMVALAPDNPDEEEVPVSAQDQAAATGAAVTPMVMDPGMWLNIPG